MAEKWAKMSFPGLVTYKKVLDNIKTYSNMKCWLKEMKRFPENGQKPHLT